jgi:hypothetical protein
MADRTGARTATWVRACAALALFVACAGDIVWENEPPDGGVARDGLTIRVLVAAADSAAAAGLGWSGRTVPQAEVWLEREGADHLIGWPPVSGMTDDSGTVSFPSLVEGRYRVNALRVLNEAETGNVPADRPNLRAFGGAIKANRLGEVELVLNANRDGLVMSEASVTGKAGVSYIWFGYVELYNNSDETIYLDGHVLGRFQSHSRRSLNDCSWHLRYTDDPAGIWARWFQRIPGSGTQYPLAPGATALVAQDAIDHTVVDADFLDLRNADFEFRTSSDPDNPGVPDMIDYGTRASLFNGIQFLPGSSPPFLAAPFDRDALTRARVLTPDIDDEFVHIPREAVLDAWTWIIGNPSTPVDICSVAVNPVFNRMPYHYRQDNTVGHLSSQQRRVVGTTPSGRKILLDTRTSSVDLVTAPHTPGWQLDG